MWRNLILRFDGYSGYQHQKGEKIIAMTDNTGYVRSPLPGAPGNATDRLLAGLNALKKVANMVGVVLTGAYHNLDAGVDSTHHRTGLFNAGMIPTSTETPRHRQRTKRGRKRFFKAAIHALRTRMDQNIAWESIHAAPPAV